MRPLMVLGTASHVGKSVLTAGFCRIFANRGLRVAPFKAQNMALNSAATPEGLEIGRAQAMQAEACRIPASVDMNPILIKPSTHTSAQVIVSGRIWGSVTASDFHQRKVRELFPLVCETFQRLAAAHDVVVLEGAGSPAEINLRDGDLVNMRMAKAAGAACLLVGDIDRGGVFASLVGTLELLEPDERALIRGFLINKFRGDRSLLMPGIRTIEARLGIPCVGIVSHLADIGIDEEDSVALQDRRPRTPAWPREAAGHARGNVEATRPAESGRMRRLRVGVVALPRLSNFTDFDALEREPSVALAYVASPDDVVEADVVILPGTKQTLDDLDWLEARGLAEAIRARASRGGLTVGICGGLQMLGRRIRDPHGVEGGGERDALGLLPIDTTLARGKVTVRARGTLCGAILFGIEVPTDARTFSGYEIHVGETEAAANALPFATLARESHPAEPAAPGAIPDGARSPDGRIIGTYLHGLFDDDGWRHAWIQAARRASDLDPATTLAPVGRERDLRYDRLAAALEAACDLDIILSWLT